jgi:hypothetical protein
MTTKTVEVLRAFTHNGGVAEVGQQVDLPVGLADTLVNSNKARVVTRDPTPSHRDPAIGSADGPPTGD